MDDPSDTGIFNLAILLLNIIDYPELTEAMENLWKLLKHPYAKIRPTTDHDMFYHRLLEARLRFYRALIGALTIVKERLNAQIGKVMRKVRKS